MMIFSAALAAPISAFPVVAEVQLPATGVVSIDVPPELRNRTDADGATDLLLVDAEGREVPLAVHRSDTHRSWVWGSAGPGRGDLRYWPQVEPGTYRVQVGSKGIDGLQVRLESEPRAATVRVYDGDTLLVEGDQWRVGGTYAEPLRLDVVDTTLRVEIDGTRDTAATFAGVRYPNGMQGTRQVVPIGPPELMEQGWIRYRIPAANGLPVLGLELMPERTLFERRALALRGDPFEELYPTWGEATRIQRLDLGGRRVEAVEVPVQGDGPELSLLLEAGAGPLEMDRVALKLASVQLLARDVGPGPHRLYGRAPEGTRRASDIQFAAGEMARVASAPTRPGPVGANPDFVSPEVRSGVALASTELATRGLTAQAPVTGPVGLDRIDLPPAVLASARRDLGDLRLMDDEGRQIPYVAVHTDDVWDWGELPFERREEGQRSYLELTLPEANLELGSIELTTEAEQFDRTVEIAQVTGGRIDTLRVVRWLGADWGGALRVDVHEPVTERIVVVIDNGDNPPLPIAGIRASRAGRAIVAHLPEGGATLLFGDPSREAPDYDLARYRWQLRDRELGVASVGQVQSRAPEPASMLDTGLVFFGVVVMALGLLGLTLALLVRTREPTEPPAEPVDEAPPDDVAEEEPSEASPTETAA